MKTWRKGHMAETAVLHKLVSKGYTVSLPYGNCARYDLLFDDGNGIKRVQVKHAAFHESRIVFSGKSHTSTLSKNNYRDDVDYFCVWCKDLPDKVYMLPEKDCNTSENTLRITPPKNNQKLYVKYAKEFEI